MSRTLNFRTRSKMEINPDGERRIIFVASSASIDRQFESVDVMSLRLPTQGGGSIIARDLPVEGATDIDIPLMLNHSFDVSDVIGSVRRAYLNGGELIFEAGLSNLPKAQEILQLIEEGHLGNAFSITMSNFDVDVSTGVEVLKNAEVIEVSVVYRGANRDARVLAVKMESKMDETKEKRNEIFGDATGDAIETVEQTEEAKAEEAKDEPKTEEAAETTEAVEEVKDEPKTKKKPENKPKEEEGDNMSIKSIASDAIMPEGATVSGSNNSGDYLKSKQALADFKNVVKKHHRGSNAEIMDDWSENLATKGITGDAILPQAIENILFKAWTDNDGILGTFRALGVRSGAIYAGTTESTALGHKKGATKKDQDVQILRRDLKALAIYKKLPIDLQDIFDDESGQLLAFRVEELATRIANQIAVGAILGTAEGDDSTKQGTRGLYPMLADINATDGFGAQVASKVTAEAGDGLYEKAIRVVGAVEDNGAGVVLVAPKGFKTAMKLQKNGNNLLVPFGASIEEVLGVKAIYELPEFPKANASGDIELIAYRDQSYTLVGETSATIRTDFDLQTNRDIMLQERYVGGSASGYKTVAGIVKA